MKNLIFRICRKILSYDTSQKKVPLRNSMEGVILHAKSLGFNPGTVIDVGAATGTFLLYNTYPAAHHILIEPILENEVHLKKIKESYSQVNYLIKAASDFTGTLTFNVHPEHPDGSSLLKEQNPEFDGVEREVAVDTLDNICKELHAKGPFLVKIDTQGNELSVLKGAENVLNQTDYVILETSFFEFYKGQALIDDIVLFMKNKGFALYDMANLKYRPLDNACGQIDLAFVKSNGLFRTSNEFATPEQWHKNY